MKADKRTYNYYIFKDKKAIFEAANLLKSSSKQEDDGQQKLVTN